MKKLPMRTNACTYPNHPQPTFILGMTEAKWLEGDWEALCQHEHQAVEACPERARIALFVAAAHHHLDHSDEALKWSRWAIDWGIEKKELASILISGIYNTLARLAALRGDLDKQESLLTQGLTLPQVFQYPIDPSSRIIRELSRIGLLNQGGNLLQKRIDKVLDTTSPTPWLETQINILKTNVELLQCELTIAQTRGQLRATQQEPDLSHLTIQETNLHWQSELKNRAMSQLGQELWVLENTHYKRGGFFVEFGATNGILLSNTYLLEKEFGWNGICAEPNPTYYEELEKNRLCILSPECIGATTGEEVEFIFADAFGGMAKDAGLDEHCLKRQAFRDAGQTAVLTTISLNDFLNTHNSPKTIDYLSVDTEGSEFSILEAFPFNQWDIKFITVEHNFTEQRASIRSLLESNGYKCHEAQWDDWYYKSEGSL
jgi:FkbM family methyltransferase